MLLCILDGESGRVKSDNADQLENHLVLQKQAQGSRQCGVRYQIYFRWNARSKND